MPASSRKRQPTMADVAARADVSHQTVSRCPTTPPASGPRRPLGYRRNQSARLLALKHSGLIGVAIWGTGQYGPQQVLLALDAAARRAGYRLAVSTLHELTERDTHEAVEELL